MQGNKNVQVKIGAQVKSGNSAVQRQPIEANKRATTAETGVKGGNSEAKKPQNTFLQGCLGCFGVLVLIGIVVIIAVAIWGEEDSPKEKQATVQTPVSANISEGVIPAQVKSLIINAVGEKTNMDEPKIVDLQVNDHTGTGQEGDKIIVAKLQGNDNLSNKMIKGGMQLESIKIFKALFDIGDVEEVALIWQYPTTDDYGNSTLNTVLKITLMKVTAEKINWSSFDKDNFSNKADSYWEHPSIRE